MMMVVIRGGEDGENGHGLLVRREHVGPVRLRRLHLATLLRDFAKNMAQCGPNSTALCTF